MNTEKLAVGMAVTVLGGLGAGIFSWGLPGGFDPQMIGIGTAEMIVAWLLYCQWNSTKG